MKKLSLLLAFLLLSSPVQSYAGGFSGGGGGSGGAGGGGTPDDPIVPADGTQNITGALTVSGIITGTTGAFAAGATASASVTGAVADGAAAVGVVLDNTNALTNTSSKLASIRSAGSEKAFVSYFGSYVLERNAAAAGGIYARFGDSGLCFGNGGGSVWYAAGASGCDTVTPVAGTRRTFMSTLGAIDSRQTVQAATGAETAFRIAPTINKATSGDYTALEVDVTETSAPGTADKILDLQVADVSKASVSNSGVVTSNGLITPPASVGASDIDWSTAGAHTKTLGANTTFTFSNMVSGQTITVILTQDAGARTVTWPTVAWKDAVAPTMTVTNGKVDIYTFMRVGSVTYGSYIQNL